MFLAWDSVSGLTPCGGTQGGLRSRVGLYSGWAYNQGGLITRVGRVGLYLGWAGKAYAQGWAYSKMGLHSRSGIGLFSRWAYSQGGLILRVGRVGLYSGVGL